MKEPDEWNGWYDRWMPSIMSSFFVLMFILYIVTGPLTWWVLLIHVPVIVLGYAVQLEYELKKGVLSNRNS